MTPSAEQATRRRRAIAAHDHPARFAPAPARKDAGPVADAVRAAGPVADAVGEAGLGPGLTAASRDRLTDAERAGHAGQDHPAVLGHIPHATAKGPQR
ncbi:hypothetical protein [Streptomyces sp. NPDC002685]|uniref:hypothetical protein n=1 Tax=Streptomyces sp. NPDC002685 TaxID=3154540 RepID=UPI0033347149